MHQHTPQPSPGSPGTLSTLSMRCLHPLGIFSGPHHGLQQSLLSLPVKTNLRARRNLASIYLTDTSTDSVASVTLDTPPLAASTQLDSTLGCEEMSISDVVSSLETIPEASDQVDWHFKVKAHIECEAESEPKPYVSGKSRMGLRPRGGVQTPARYKYMN